MPTTLSYGFIKPVDGDNASSWMDSLESNVTLTNDHTHNGTNSAQLSNSAIASAAAIARSKLAAGTANHVVINAGDGTFSSEATLAKSRGGTAQDNSSVTFPASGVLVTEAGTQTLTNKTVTIGSSASKAAYFDGSNNLAAETTLAVARGGTNLASYTAGDLLYASGATTLAKLAVGSNGQYLKLVAGLPAWAATAFTLAVAAKTSGYTATSADDFISCDATSAGFTITLPAAASNTGKVFYIKKIDSSANAVTIDGNASETIDGAATVTITLQYESLTIVCDGSNWHII